MGGSARLGFAVLSAFAAVGSMLWAVVFHLVFWLDVKGATREDRPVKLAPRDVQVLAVLRQRVVPGRLVFRSEQPSTGYNQHGGLPTPWLGPAHSTSKASGFMPRFPEREALLRQLPPDPERYRRENIHWFVLDVNERLARHTADWIREGRAELVLEHEGLRVIRLQ